MESPRLSGMAGELRKELSNRYAGWMDPDTARHTTRASVARWVARGAGTGRNSSGQLGGMD